MRDVFDAYAVYYDLLYKEKDYQTETKYVMELLLKRGINSGSILELGCGTGKHAEQLAYSGFSVHGIDLSSKMIEKANQCKNKNFSKRLFFETGDARNYSVEKKFSVVISLFHVASYMSTNEHLESMFETAAKHLKPGGIFIFDYWYGPGVITNPPSVRIKRLENEDVKVFRIAEPEMYPNENLVDVNYSVQVKKKDTQNIIEINETHKMRYLFIPEIKQLSKAWFNLDANFAWMKDKKPNFCDWLCISVLIRK